MSPRPRRSHGFTLVEILVVVAIIVILMAILIPVAAGMIGKARNTQIAVEISQIKAALEEYKNKHGDYPPSMDWDPMPQPNGKFAANLVAQGSRWLTNNSINPNYRYSSICERHLVRCYPKAIDKDKFYVYIAPRLEQDEALVFWLCMITNDPREPFKNFALNTNNNPPTLYYAGGNDITQLNFSDFPGAFPRNVYYDFDSRRLVDGDNDGIPGYEAAHCKGTTYMYFDSRTYGFTQYNKSANQMYAARGVAQPFGDAVAIAKNQSKFMNPNTYQILCSGQDGNFGLVMHAFDQNDNFVWGLTKQFPTMINTNEEDSDNIADFTEGRKLIDHRP